MKKMASDKNSQAMTRRRFLAGIGGAALSLPYFESMAAAAKVKPAVRMAFFYLPNGLVRKGFFPGEGTTKIWKGFAGQNNVWRFPGKAAPVGSHELTFTPTLSPLKKMKDKITLITGLDRTFQQGTDSHAQAASCFLTSSAPYAMENSVYPLSRSLDHVAADRIGQSTPFTTLELSCNNSKDNVESIYFDNMSWYGLGHVAPSMRNPRKVYDRLFGTDANTRYRNITDLALQNAKDLQRRLATADQRKFDEYFEAIRSIEKRMDKIDGMRNSLVKYKGVRPDDHLPRNEYIQIMGDLMVTALQSGLTNVASLMIGAERWSTTFKYEGILDKPENHHRMTHSMQTFIDPLLKLDRFHLGVYARMVEKMDGIQEANGTTLLDNTIFTLGAGLGDGASHQYNDLPLVVAGGGGGVLRQGRHIQCERKTPLANLWLTQLHALGIERKTYADSTGTISDIMT